MKLRVCFSGKCIILATVGFGVGRSEKQSFFWTPKRTGKNVEKAENDLLLELFLFVFFGSCENVSKVHFLIFVILYCFFRPTTVSVGIGTTFLSTGPRFSRRFAADPDLADLADPADPAGLANLYSFFNADGPK